MKNHLLIIASLLLATLFCFGTSPVVKADVNDFSVTSFTSDQTLSRKDKQGELRVTERIKVDFTDNNHGILRAIPKSYKHHSLQLKILKVISPSGAPAGYTTYDSNGNKVLKIGDANKTVTGSQEYVIDYELRNVISFEKDHDELYWDVNGDQWQQPFQQVAVTLHLPADLKQANKPICYAGAYNSKDQDCTISADGNTVQAVTNKPLLGYQTLTYVAGFEKGYFESSKWYDTLGEYAKTIGAILIPAALLGGSGFLYWWRRGRDPKGRGTIVPQYDAPDGLKPAEVGALMDFKVDNRDITATIIDLAIRGYLKIVETKKDRLLAKDKLTYKLQLTKADFTNLDANEKLLISALFTDAKPAGSEVDVSASKNKLYATVSKLQSAIQAQLVKAGYFRDKSLKTFSRAKTLAVLLIFIALATSMVILGPLVIGGTVIGGIIGVMFLAAMDARTRQGVAAKEHALGLKRYLEVAEKHRIEKLQAPDAKYATNAAEPVKTVDLFEKLLPYAMVLGVEKKWAEQFKDLYTAPPDWYSGNWSTFGAVYLVSSLNSGVGSAVNTAFSSPSSSGSSGFGGVGFSGGGGGGGGGGGW